MELKIETTRTNEFLSNIYMKYFDGDRVASHASFGLLDSRYGGNYVKTLTAGGIGTEPEYRRGGFVREMMNRAFEMSREYGAIVSMLHPFSFGYYRKFGYERVCDHLILEFPISKLEFVERNPDLVLYRGGERTADLLKIFDKFSETRNIMFRRFDERHFPVNPNLNSSAVYIDYRNGEPVGYIKLSVEKVLYVNHMENVNLHIYEMAYTDREALCELLGFVRMFEGENDTVKVHNAAMMPELDMLLRHYTHTRYTTVPDIMAKVLDTGAMLKSARYPRECGHFRLAVDDALEAVRGLYEVEYGDGDCTVKRVGEVGDGYCDVRCDAPALSQILYGYYALTPEVLAYMHGVKIEGDASDICRAFPKNHGGLFEHF